MKRVGSKTMLVLAAAMMLMSSEAFAWVCTAQNAGGTNYTGAGAVLWRAKARALARCKANSAHPATCTIVGCG